jgi:hypothetical protein
MHKPIVVFLIIVLSATAFFDSSAAGFGAPEVEWSEIYSGYMVASVIQTSDLGYAISGTGATFLPDGHLEQLEPLLLKVNSTGAIQWEKTYPFKGYKALSVIQTSQDLGYALIFNGGVMLKLDANGKAQWNRDFALNYYQYCEAMQTSDGGYAIIGQGNAGVLIKTDYEGNALWNKTFGGSSGSSINDVFETEDGDIAVLGSWGMFPWFAKTDADGNLILNQTFALIPGPTVFYSAAESEDGGFTLAGGDGTYAYLTAMSSEGVVQWNKQFEPSRYGFVSIVQTKDGGYAAFDNYTIVRTNSLGNSKWTLTFDPENNTLNDFSLSYGYPGNPMTLIEDGGYAVVGTYGSPNRIFLTKFTPESEIGPDETGLSLTLIVIAVIIVVVVSFGLVAYFLSRKKMRPA